MQDKIEVEVNIRDRVLRPVSEVFAAIVDPAKMSRYFISRAKRTDEARRHPRMDFRRCRGEAEIDENRRIVFDWGSQRAFKSVIRKTNKAGRRMSATLISRHQLMNDDRHYPPPGSWVEEDNLWMTSEACRSISGRLLERSYSPKKRRLPESTTPSRPSVGGCQW
jgi:uncharacterized protein YndB with AHSA1/START domain